MCFKDLFGGPFLCIYIDSSPPVNFRLSVWGTTFYIEFRRIACVSKR